MGGLAEATTNELALIPKSKDQTTQRARVQRLTSDKCSEITVMALANAHAVATHKARTAKADSASFPV